MPQKHLCSEERRRDGAGKGDNEKQVRTQTLAAQKRTAAYSAFDAILSAVKTRRCECSYSHKYTLWEGVRQYSNFSGYFQL